MHPWGAPLFVFKEREWVHLTWTNCGLPVRKEWYHLMIKRLTFIWFISFSNLLDFFFKLSEWNYSIYLIFYVLFKKKLPKTDNWKITFLRINKVWLYFLEPASCTPVCCSCSLSTVDHVKRKTKFFSHRMTQFLCSSDTCSLLWSFQNQSHFWHNVVLSNTKKIGLELLGDVYCHFSLGSCFCWSDLIVHPWLRSRLMYIKWPKNTLLHYTTVHRWYPLSVPHLHSWGM